MARIVVLGALGHIGSALIRSPQLIGTGDELVLVDDLTTQRYASLFDLPSSGRYRFVQGDAGALVGSLVDSSVRAVVQLAGASDPGAIAADPALAMSGNLRITRMAIEACGTAGVPLFLPSTTSVYASSGTGLTEEAPVAGTHAYTECKLEEEALLTNAFAQGLQGTIARFGTIVGPSPGMRFHTAVNRFCWQAATGAPLSVWTSALHQVRPYLAIGDAVSLIAQSITSGTWLDSVVNAASFNVTVEDVIASISRVIPDASITRIDSALMNDLSFSVSTSRAAQAGFTCSGTLDAEVARTLALLRGIIPGADTQGSPHA